MPYNLETTQSCDVTYEDFHTKSAARHLVLGLIMLVLCLVEYFTFFNYPLQKALVIEANQRTAEEQMILENAEDNEDGQDADLYMKLFGNKIRNGFRVSYLNVLELPEI
jgi:hypothetical protein